VSSFLSELGGITAGVGAEGLAFAAGFAAGHALEPEALQIAQAAWHAAQVRRLDPNTAADVVAEHYGSLGDMESEASYSGIDATRFAYLYDLALTAPGMGELIAMLRRSDEVQIDFTHGLRKAKLETEWDAALRNLADQRLAATDIAYMVVRGVLPDEGLLGLSLPTQADNLKLPPQHSLNPITEAARTGWDAERLAMMIARSGLAMAPVMAAQARFRGILTQNDYELTIARGDLFPAYADPVLEVSRQILTAGEYAELQLRGFLTATERRTQTARHGMTQADSDLLYDVLGRAPSIRQAYIGLARGATYDGNPTTIPEPFLSAAQRSNIRPEWYSIAYENRYSLPSAFVVRTLLTDGAIDATRAQSIFEHSGWPPDLATLVADHYAAKAGGGTAADPHVTKAQNHVWTVVQSSYEKDRTDDAQATAALTKLGVTAGAIPEILSLWQVSRAIVRAGLTPAQIKKAYGEATFTQPEAVARLVELGWSAADAGVYLGE
jgi:hypothetical protein